MTKEEIIRKWNEGFSKNQLALMYKNQYNLDITKIRLNIKNRHSGKFISNYEALKYVEQILYDECMKKNI